MTAICDKKTLRVRDNIKTWLTEPEIDIPSCQEPDTLLGAHTPAHQIQSMRHSHQLMPGNKSYFLESCT